MDLAKNLKIIIFDFDGTLHELAVDWERAMQLVEAEPSEGLADAIERHKKTGNPEPAKKLEMLEAEALKDQVLKPHITEALKRLSEKYKIAVFTRNSGAPIKALLERSGINPDLVIGRDEVSKQKPSPEGLSFILEKFNLRPKDALMVGDTWHDVKVAQSTGVKSVIVGSKFATKPEGLKPDYCLVSIADLIL